MTLTVLIGPTGSGKSRHLIEAVNDARASGRRTSTFLSRSAVLRSRNPALWMHNQIACREPGLRCPLDHVVYMHECEALLNDLGPGSLAVFEEAHYFEPEIAEQWAAASRRGVDVLVATPSAPHLERLRTERTVEKRLTVLCSSCRQREASETFVLPEALDSSPFCEECARNLVGTAKEEMLERLESQPPYPGERALYQPIELQECASWRVLRADSSARAELLRELVIELADRFEHPPNTYLDVGCNTGYFCTAMSRAGLAATGVDIVKGDIEVARLLAAYIRKDDVRYIVANVYEYLRDTRNHLVDIVSAFSVVQWLILQRSLEHGLEALSWLFEKATQACVLEIGYSSEEIYRDKLPVTIDREWVEATMLESKCFSEVRCLPAGTDGLMRDVFVGFVADSRPELRRDNDLNAISSYDDPEVLASRLSPVIVPLLRGSHRRRHFEAWERRGLHITPVDFYQPVPDSRTLEAGLWQTQSSLAGIEMNEAEQLRLLSEIFPRFREEYDAIPHVQSEDGGFFLGNGMFDGMDALVYYCMVRALRPRRIVEVGSGFSTQLALRATQHNGPTEIVAIDPYPSTALEEVSERLTAVLAQPVQEVEKEVFLSLEQGDILFIDSSHVSRIGSDVNHLVLEVLPELLPGVVVHFHDVFLPNEYPKEWILERGRYWNEQYLLQAFLAFNMAYEVVLANSFLGRLHPVLLRDIFPKSPWWGGGSFWIRRR